MVAVALKPRFWIAVVLALLVVMVIEAAPLWGFVAGTAAGGLAGLAAAFSGGPLGDGHLSAVGPSGFRVGLVAILEIGVTAALAAAAANWFILRRAPRGVWGGGFPPRIGGIQGGRPPGETQRPPGPTLVDETDNADGHRIYLNPWAAEDQEDW